jgi:phage baseplate assembly protein W
MFKRSRGKDREGNLTRKYAPAIHRIATAIQSAGALLHTPEGFPRRLYSCALKPLLAYQMDRNTDVKRSLVASGYAETRMTISNTTIVTTRSRLPFMDNSMMADFEVRKGTFVPVVRAEGEYRPPVSS